MPGISFSFENNLRFKRKLFEYLLSEFCEIELWSLNIKQNECLATGCRLVPECLVTQSLSKGPSLFFFIVLLGRGVYHRSGQVRSGATSNNCVPPFTIQMIITLGQATVRSYGGVCIGQVRLGQVQRPTIVFLPIGDYLSQLGLEKEILFNFRQRRWGSSLPGLWDGAHDLT